MTPAATTASPVTAQDMFPDTARKTESAPRTRSAFIGTTPTSDQAR